MSTKKTEISTEIAIEELTTFLKKYRKKDFRRGKVTEEDIKKDYVDVIEAIEDGLLVFKNGNPVYTLSSPLKNSEGTVILKDITFRSRVRPADKAIVMNGLDIA